MDLNQQKLADLKTLRFDRHQRYREWKGYMAKYDCQTICEIGVRQGFNFYYMVEHKPQLAVAVDCWIEDGVAGRNDSCFDQAGLDRQYEKFKNATANQPFIKICKGYSFDVVKEFPDKFFDFIFIDADHTYEGVSRDLADWWPKVKKGGVFSGHDYIQTRKKMKNGKIIRVGVIKAVDEFVAKNNITDFGVLQPNPTWVVIK